MDRPARPNIVFIITDQQRFDTIAAAGFDYMTTPQLDRVEIGDLKVHWLLGVPITEAERQWLEVNGFDDFVDLLDAKAVNYTDLQRPSAV